MGIQARHFSHSCIRFFADLFFCDQRAIQTSPKYALRSYSYLLLHVICALLFRAICSTLNLLGLGLPCTKSMTFYFIRFLLAASSSASDAVLCALPLPLARTQPAMSTARRAALSSNTASSRCALCRFVCRAVPRDLHQPVTPRRHA